ncbi:hypothetical protein EYF80_065884 [Liparis tanakae]|uniref:Uncharacterized protein n=1 Tax=Liparis tanakae TaxID=230148 RepID=A0A4Z2E5R8_9TELE|nr:hypothetical protein EYF80_065884 [Liparis tanakae]
MPVVAGSKAMTGVVRWNFRSLVDLKLPGVELPAVFDHVLIAEVNNLSAKHRCPYPPLIEPIAAASPGVGEVRLLPSRVFSLYEDQGMGQETAWGDFLQSPFFEVERDRWVTERKK